MTHVTCRLTAKNRDLLRNPTLGNRVWATFTFFSKEQTSKIYLLACLQNQIPDKKIEMRWRFKSWPEGHHSKVTLQLVQKSDGTELRLKQTGIPANSFEQTQDGWQNYYWKSIKQTFGYGAFFY